MAEYIEREALLKKLNEVFPILSNYNLPKSLRKIVNEIHAADVVEVVRCQECKRYRPETAISVTEKGKHVRYCSCDFLGRITRDGDFCSWGARMDGE